MKSGCGTQRWAVGVAGASDTMNILAHLVADIILIWFTRWTFEEGLDPLLSWGVVVLMVFMVVMTFYAAWSDLFMGEGSV